MEPTTELSPIKPQQTPNQRNLLIAGLAIIAFGLLFLILGIVLGYLRYEVDRPLYQMQQEALSQMTIETEDGLITTPVDGPVVPSFGSTVFMQQPTWLGVVGLIVGLCMIYMSVPRVVDDESASLPEDVAVLPPALSDEPFDLDG